MERNNFFARFTNRAPAAGPVEFLVVGLGKPGREYENTRHNAGFLAADRIAEKHHASIDRLKFKGTVGQCRLGGKGVLLLKPGTYMNLSGQSVTEAMRSYKLKPEQVLVIFDDISLPVGRIRLRQEGSAGGHNGVKSIIRSLGSEQFPRIKVGVGEKPHPDYDLADWVLSKFSAQEEKALAPAVEHAVDAALLFLDEGYQKAASAYNGK